VGEPESQPSRRLSENPGLTGAVIDRGQTLYLPDMMLEEVINTYAPVGDDHKLVLHTFLGIPLKVNDMVIGVLSIQSTVIDAYSADQIQLMENVAVQAALAIDKSRLFDQLKKELNERSRVEIDLRQRESILEAVTFAAEQFLKTSDWRLNIDNVLERLGKTMHVTHAYLFEDHLDMEGQAVTSMRYEWTAPGYPSDLNSPYFQNSKLDMQGYEDQVEAMRQGDVRAGNSSTFNPIEKEAMDEFGVKAILEVPIFVNKKDWGAIGFDDFEQQREWTSAEVDALKIAAGVLSAAIQREEADSALQESERIYRRAIEAADAVPYYQDYASNSYLFIGEGIRAMTGYEPQEMYPDRWEELVEETVMLGEAAGMEIDDVIEAVRNGKIKAWKCDQKIRTRDGKIRWLTDRSVELLDAQNISHGSIGILQDITDRKLTEAGLRKRESILEAITFSAEQFLKTSNWRENMDIVLERLGKEFDATHAYLFGHHPNARGEIVASMQYEWTAPGYTSDLEDQTFQNSYPIHDGESSDSILSKGIVFAGNLSTFPPMEKERLTQLGIKAMIEVPLFVKDEWWGTIGLDDMEVEREWSLAEIDALKIAAGILSAAIQRQDAESAVQESERIYRQAIEAADAVPYFRNHDLNMYIFMGKGIRDITGYAPGEINPTVWSQLVVGAELSGELAGLTEPEAIQLAREGKVKAWKCDYRIRARDGKTRWIADSAVELFGDNSLSYASIGIMQDITERKQIEANLQNELEQRALLINELESKNQELERFTYTVSHDLKSPLVTISGFLGYLEKDAMEGNFERLHQDSQRIQEAVSKMQRLLSELLELSRIGRMMNSPQVVAFEELVGDAMAIVHGQLEEGAIMVQTQPGLPTVYGDKPRLVEVLQNLLDNAAKYMGAQPNPRIEIGQRGAENHMPVFYVKDNGIGIAPAHYDRIFGLFNKLDVKTEGTGVGLALVKRIIEVHGGRIWIESQEGQGSSFLFTLPAQPPPDSVL
jgi:PAS domain S-box-containing protein